MREGEGEDERDGEGKGRRGNEEKGGRGGRGSEKTDRLFVPLGADPRSRFASLNKFELL